MTKRELLALAQLGAKARIDQLDRERKHLVALMKSYRGKPTTTHPKPPIGRKPLAPIAPSLHWTQRPENRARVRRMLKTTAAKRKAKR